MQDRGVTYTALDLATALAEVFQLGRLIRRHHGGPYVSSWRPTRALALLDLTGKWPIRNGASYTINSGRRDHCRAWARAIHTAWPEFDGLYHHSSLTGEPLVTLFTHAADTFPARPAFSVPLDSPGLIPHVVTAARSIGYRLD